jgi:A/G-specific adenine glycosylase
MDLTGIRKHLTDWYGIYRRNLPWRQTSDPYAIWVSEVMLQQTQVKTVLAYYSRFIRKFPDIHTLAASRLEDVLKLWEGLGYYARARNFHRAAEKVVLQFAGSIPRNIEEFKKLPGVGEYMAAAVMSIAFDQPFAVIDGNVRRVMARLFQIETPVNDSGSHRGFKAHAQRLLEADSGSPGIFNQAMMELGALVCKPRNPACSDCPVSSRCIARLSDRVADYPAKIRRLPSPLYYIAVGVVKKGGRLLITQRKPEGLLGGLWEFPGGKIREEETSRSACIREIKEEVNLDVEIDSYLTRVKHAYTHFKISMDVFLCNYLSGEVILNGPVNHRWVRPKEISRYPFPKANLKFVPLLYDRLMK